MALQQFMAPVALLRFEMWLEGTLQLLSDPMAPGSLRYRPCAVQLMNLTADKEKLTLKAMAWDLWSLSCRIFVGGTGSAV